MPHVTLVGPELEENLSLRYLAASLARAGYAADILAFNHPGDLPRVAAQILAAPPTLVGLSLAFQWRAQDFLALAMELRRRGYQGHITVGGHFGTFAHADLLADFPEIDSVVRQEAEETLVALYEAVAGNTPLGRVAGLAARDDTGRVYTTGEARLPDLADLPWPDRRGEPATCFGHGIAPLVSSRGCYANCTFCCIAAWHEQSLPGKRYRLRDVNAVAAEMVDLQRTRGIDVFVFHDDNFFVPGHRRNRERFGALADALERRGIGPYATVVKARPTDVNPEVFGLLQRRLHCIRVYIGVESDADQGLETLRRWASSKQNHRAIQIVRDLDLYACFNMLLFDPDTTLESIATNVAFLRHAAEFPSNFGRVELYAGTPLLARMQAEGRCRGDWMQWDYDLATPEVERVFALAMRCFHERNFGDDALANSIMGTRFDVEVCRKFHPESFSPAWGERGKALSRTLARSTADGLQAILDHVGTGGCAPGATRDDDLVAELSARLRETEREVRRAATAFAEELEDTLRRGPSLTRLGDRVATPLQTMRSAQGV